MFDRLKKAFGVFSKKVEKEAAPAAAKDAMDLPAKPVKKLAREKKGFLQRLSEVELSESRFEDLFEDFEIDLLENNVAYEVVQSIHDKLKKDLVGKSLKRSELEKLFNKDVKAVVQNVFKEAGELNLANLEKTHKPLVILFIGVNGVGKITTIAKIAKYYLNKKKSVVIAAGDTFRAAAIEQIEHHAKKLKVNLIKHQYKADSAAVCFDAIKHAQAKKIDVVLLESAGRSHANTDLMDELAKVRRVAKPQLTILVVDALTGNDSVEQAQTFSEKIGFDGTIISKSDADRRGGVAVSIASASKKPILFVGTGQDYKDIKPFDSKEYLKALGF